MTKPIHVRLKAVRNALKLSQRDFSKGIYISQSNYARIEQGLIKTNDRMVELICSKYHVSRQYLRLGRGPMFSRKPPDKKLAMLNQIFDNLNKHFQDYLLVLARELLTVQTKERADYDEDDEDEDGEDYDEDEDGDDDWDEEPRTRTRRQWPEAEYGDEDEDWDEGEEDEEVKVETEEEV
jgi:transcriptional regulator with XRE-family HTH domain